MRIPDDEHAVVARIGSHNPVLVLTAQDRSDLIAVTLQQLLLFRDIVVNDASVRRRVKNFSPLFVRQEVNTLIDVLVESIDFV